MRREKMIAKRGTFFVIAGLAVGIVVITYLLTLKTEPTSVNEAKGTSNVGADEIQPTHVLEYDLPPARIPPLNCVSKCQHGFVDMAYTAANLPENTQPVWVSKVSRFATASVENGILTLDTTSSVQESARFTQNWTASNIYGSVVQARMRLDYYIGKPSLGGAAIWVEDDAHVEVLLISPERIQLYFSKLSYSMDTTDAYHTFRITVLGDSINVYVDGELVIDGAGTFGRSKVKTSNWIAFGDGSAGASSKSSWDYVQYCYCTNE
jgi:hypothetical protein